MTPFTYTGLPARVLFGRGATTRADEMLAEIGVRRPLVLTTPRQSDLGEAVLGGLMDAAGLFTEAAMHTPVAVTERALAAYGEAGADGVVSVGGGSTIGLGKAIALRNGAPQLAIPTTYAGSEMTPIIGQTEDGRKTTRRTPDVLPEAVIYDVDHTMGLPVAMSVTSGINAVAHAAEALYAEGANPVLALMAEEGVRALHGALGKVIDRPDDADARERALYGAWLCAICLGSGGVALHHKLAHVVGGSFDLPHAETHTVLLPYALRYNAPAVPDAMAVLDRAVGGDAPTAIRALAERAGAPAALRALGMPEEGIDLAVRQTLETPYPNPRPLEAGPLAAILRAAWAGDPLTERAP